MSDAENRTAVGLTADVNSSAAPAPGSAAAEPAPPTPLSPTAAALATGTRRGSRQSGRSEKADWEGAMMRLRPGVLELRERLRGPLGLASFATEYNARRTENRGALAPEMGIQLIVEYLESVGMESVAEQLAAEAGVAIHREPRVGLSRLEMLLKIGIQDVEQVS